MNRRERTIKQTTLARIPAEGTKGERVRVLRVTLFHFERRGYVATANVYEHGNGDMTCWPMAAASILVQVVPRFNAKAFESLTVAPEIIEQLEAKTLVNNAETAARVAR